MDENEISHRYRIRDDKPIGEYVTFYLYLEKEGYIEYNSKYEKNLRNHLLSTNSDVIYVQDIFSLTKKGYNSTMEYILKIFAENCKEKTNNN